MNTNYLTKAKDFHLFYKVLLNTECCIWFQDLYFLFFLFWRKDQRERYSCSGISVKLVSAEEKSKTKSSDVST